MKVVILAGGFGTRLAEETDVRPKPMVEIGGMPILMHLMLNFYNQGFSEFVIPVGYMGEVIVEYFLAHSVDSQKRSVRLSEMGDWHTFRTAENWSVTVVQTGLQTLTGGRLAQLEPFLDGSSFICTYGDGLSDVVLKDLVNFHKSHGKIATVTAAHPISRFGILTLSPDRCVTNFQEKERDTSWVNSGFFVFTPQIFNYLDCDHPLEESPMRKLILEQELMAWLHSGSWLPMDTHRDKSDLENLWSTSAAFWKNW